MDNSIVDFAIPAPPTVPTLSTLQARARGLFERLDGGESAASMPFMTDVVSVVAGLARMPSAAEKAGQAQADLTASVEAASAASKTAADALADTFDVVYCEDRNGFSVVFGDRRGFIHTDDLDKRRGGPPSLTELRARARELLADAMQRLSDGRGDGPFARAAIDLADAVARLSGDTDWGTIGLARNLPGAA